MTTDPAIPDQPEPQQSVTMEDYQEKAYSTAIYPGKGKALGVLYVMMGLINESAEAADRVDDFGHFCDSMLTDPLNDHAEKASARGLAKEIHRSLCNADDTGEELGRLKKVIRDEGLLPFPAETEMPVLTEENKAKVKKELGDVLWYLAGIASELGLSLTEVAQMNLDKLASRAERGKIGGSGDDR